MDAFERAQAKSQQMTELKSAILPLEENQTIHLPIDESIVLTLEDIKMYLNSVSKSIKRYAVFFRGDKFSVIRLADNLDLRSVYEDDDKPKTKKAKPKEQQEPAQTTEPLPAPEPNAIDLEYPKEKYERAKLDNMPARKDAHPGFQLAEDYMRSNGQL